MGKAILLIHKKHTTSINLGIEIVVWILDDDLRYKHKAKYRLVLFDPQTRKVIILFDNHYPRGDHYHYKEKIYVYEFISIKVLIIDFKLMVAIIEEEYENKKISD